MIPNKPITRKEMYYSAILGDTTQVPEPITREEQYLNAIVENGTGGGGGGGGEVTKGAIEKALGYTPDQQPKKMDYTLDPAQWTGEGFPYLYTIPLPDTTANQRIYATAPPGLTEEQINAFAEACITGKEQTDGQIVLQAVNKPTTELPIVIEIGGVMADASD